MDRYFKKNLLKRAKTRRLFLQNQRLKYIFTVFENNFQVFEIAKFEFKVTVTMAYGIKAPRCDPLREHHSYYHDTFLNFIPDLIAFLGSLTLLIEKFAFAKVGNETILVTFCFILLRVKEKGLRQILCSPINSLMNKKCIFIYMPKGFILSWWDSFEVMPSKVNLDARPTIVL